MDERTALLRHIADDPDDDLPRPVYADWLHENGDEALAEFIRVDCELYRHTVGSDAPTLPRKQLKKLRGRRAALWNQHRSRWLPEANEQPWPGTVWVDVRRGLPSDLLVQDGAAFQASFSAVELPGVYRAYSVALSHTYLGPKAVRGLAESPHFACLEGLSLSFQGVGDSGLTALARSPHLARLSSLLLAGNSVGDQGARALAESSHLTRLRALDLSNNRIGDDGAEALAASANLADLGWLELRGNEGITASGQRVLREQFQGRVRLGSWW